MRPRPDAMRTRPRQMLWGRGQIIWPGGHTGLVDLTSLMVTSRSLLLHTTDTVEGRYSCATRCCSVYNLLLSSYRWTYNDAPFDPSGVDGRIAIQPGSGTLIFARPWVRDEAYYQCFAENVVGVAVSDNTNLRVGSKLTFELIDLLNFMYCRKNCIQSKQFSLIIIITSSSKVI